MIFSEYHQQAINLLAKAYSNDFAKYIESTEAYTELVQQLAGEYIARNIPIVNEEAEYDLALELCDKLTVKG